MTNPQPVLLTQDLPALALDILQRVRRLYPTMAVTTNAADILTSPDIDAVAIVTPIAPTQWAKTCRRVDAG